MTLFQTKFIYLWHICCWSKNHKMSKSNKILKISLLFSHKKRISKVNILLMKRHIFWINRIAVFGVRFKSFILPWLLLPTKDWLLNLMSGINQKFTIWEWPQWPWKVLLGLVSTLGRYKCRPHSDPNLPQMGD